MTQFDVEVAALAKQQKLYRPGTLAQILDTPEETIRGWIRTGTLKAFKVPGSTNVYIKREHVDELLERLKPVIRRAQ